MSDLSTIFTNIADSIRDKAKITNTMLPSEMPHYIDEIEAGGGSDGTITRNVRIGERVASSLSLTANVYESEV
jgi:hypothetical protein